MFDRVVVCIDSEPPGVHAGEVATDLSARLGSHLTFVTVLTGTSRGGQADLERLVPHGAEGRSIQHRLDEAKTRAVSKGVPQTEIVYLQGSVADEILHFLQSTSPDLVVVGTRGLSRGSRLILGSVSSRLVAEAPCPVLVVRPLKGRRRAVEKAPVHPPAPPS